MAARASTEVGTAVSLRGLQNTAGWSASWPAPQYRVAAPLHRAVPKEKAVRFIVCSARNLTHRPETSSLDTPFVRGFRKRIHPWHKTQVGTSGPAKGGWRQAGARSMAAGGAPAHDGKVIVVTGVSKGLGQSLAVELVSRGHTVVGCARSEASVKAIADRLGDPHSFSVVDVASDKEVKSWADATIKRFGVPDIVVNNAGLINKNAPLWEVPVEEFDAVIDVNLKGPANVIRHFVPHMVAKQRGIIVNMSSGWGRSAAPDVAPYCTTKWGVEGMSRSLARELPRGCVAVALNPGVINTDMLQSCFGPSASMYQTADTWSRDAADLILSINANDNGSSMTVT